MLIQISLYSTVLIILTLSINVDNDIAEYNNSTVT